MSTGRYPQEYPCHCLIFAITTTPQKEHMFNMGLQLLAVPTSSIFASILVTKMNY